MWYSKSGGPTRTFTTSSPRDRDNGGGDPVVDVETISREASRRTDARAWWLVEATMRAPAPLWRSRGFRMSSHERKPMSITPIPMTMKMEVLDLHGWNCLCCGRPTRRYPDARVRPDTLSFDHVVPEKHGGLTTVDNLQVLCM